MLKWVVAGCLLTIYNNGWQKGRTLKACNYSTNGPSKHWEFWKLWGVHWGRLRFMTAITPAYAHAYQATCLTRHMPAVPHRCFRLPRPKARYTHLPNVRTTTRERGNVFPWMGHLYRRGTRVVDGETAGGFGVIARSHHGRIGIMFGLVVTTEAHLAFSGTRTHSNNTAEVTAMIESLSFLRIRVFIMTPNMLLARFKPAHTFS